MNSCRSSFRLVQLLVMPVLLLLLTASSRAAAPPAPVTSAVSCPGNLSAFAYNAFVNGDFTAQNTDVQGRLAAAGTVNVNNYAIASRLTAASAGNLRLCSLRIWRVHAQEPRRLICAVRCLTQR